MAVVDLEVMEMGWVLCGGWECSTNRSRAEGWCWEQIRTTVVLEAMYISFITCKYEVHFDI